ncbi:hypothetical protein RclHR1_04320003 [Rhizophagus clarus]|uniref:Protein kinase domain-containing protein n=1 Tax=Rhizophagus clarus TaxID=94130 RepID=A0A2Z6RZ26_9GLOM|nr:hypothetical protein RclHR1_04320003 [Rhizophagus clarus]
MDKNSAIGWQAPEEVVSTEIEGESNLPDFLSLIEEMSSIYDEMVEICQTTKHNNESCELILSRIEKADMALTTVISKIREFLAEDPQLKISECLNNEFDFMVQLLNLDLEKPYANFLPSDLKRLKFLPPIREVTKIYDEISEIHKLAQYNKRTCCLMLKKVEIADTALNNLRIHSEENLKYFSKENYINLCHLVTIIDKIRKLLAEISQFESYQKFIQIEKYIEIFRCLNSDFNSTGQLLNFSSLVSPTESLVCTGKESASKIEVPFVSFLPLIEDVNKLYNDIYGIYNTAQYNEKTCEAMLEKAEDIKEKFGNLNDEFDTTIRLLQFFLVVYFNARADDEKKIKADIEEEWIRKKIKDEDIHYFEYKEFNDIEEIGKGGFGVVYKAVTNYGMQVAFKGLIEKKTLKIEKDDIIKFVNELKLVRMVDFHQNVNSFLGIAKDDIGNYIMVLEYANEGNLRDYLKEKFDSLQWKNKVQMALDITCGLNCLHSKDIIHRDLHSKNILVHDGVLFWEITSGRPPFSNRDDQSIFALCHHICSGHREEPIEGTPLKYQQLYQKCWDGDPESRPDVNQVYDEILSQFNEELVRRKMKENDVHYYEHREFNEIKKIEGGFGVVNKGEPHNKKQYTLKYLIDKKGSRFEEKDIENLAKQLKILYMISRHNNINSFLGISKDGFGYVMVLEYANNGNLRDYLNVNFDSLNWENKIRMALDITLGLKHLHSKGITHKNLHSNNILVSDGKLLIADLGLPKHLTEATLNSPEIIGYIDPQCYKKINYIRDKKSDIYSLGVLLWEITSGRPPFHTDKDGTEKVTEQNNLRNRIGHLNLREKPVGGPLKYQQLYQKCWDGDPGKRPDIDQIHSEILSIFNNRDASTYPPNMSHEINQSNTDDTNSLDYLSIQSSRLELCGLCIERENNNNSDVQRDNPDLFIEQEN